MSISSHLLRESELDSLVRISDGEIIVTNKHGDEYQIPLTRVENANHIVHWVWKLTERGNYDMDVIREFCEIAAQSAGFDAKQ